MSRSHGYSTDKWLVLREEHVAGCDGWLLVERTETTDHAMLKDPETLGSEGYVS